jgi:hypothetical protein
VAAPAAKKEQPRITLLWVKLGNLVVLLWLRAVVMRRLYPQSKLY